MPPPGQRIQLLYCAHATDRGLVGEFDSALRRLDTAGLCAARQSPQLRSAGASEKSLSDLLAQVDVVCVFMTADYGSSAEWLDQLAPLLGREDLAGKTILLQARPYLLLSDDLAPLRLRHPSREDAFILQELRVDGSAASAPPADTDSAGSAHRQHAWQAAAAAVFHEAQHIQRQKKESATLDVVSTSSPDLAGGLLLDTDALRCGRWEHYSKVTEPRRRHEIIVVPGELFQGHKQFLLLLQRQWAGAERQIHYVDLGVAAAGDDNPWFPRRLQGFLDALALPLGCPATESDLRERIADVLQDQDLIFLHSPIGGDFEHPTLLRYYRSVLPSLLPASTGEHAVKCIQPLSWPHTHILAQSLGLLLRPLVLRDPLPRWLLRWLLRRAANRLLHTLQAPQEATAQPPALPVPSVPQLSQITDSQVREFLAEVCPSPASIDSIVEEVTRGQTSEQRLSLLSDSLIRYRRRS